MRYIQFIIALFLIISIISGKDGLIRGHSEGEIYFSVFKYSTGGHPDGDGAYFALYRDRENGANPEEKFVYDEVNPEGPNMGAPILSIDKQLYGLYCGSYYDLWFSSNRGEDWTLTNDLGGYFTSGCTEGEIYKRNGMDLYKSENYGLEFTAMYDSIWGSVAIGNIPGEIYMLYYVDAPGYGPFEIRRSTNYGETFEYQSTIDTVFDGDHSSSYPPRIFRGAIHGELYLCTWHSGHNLKIYRSADYGVSFELFYEFPTIDYFIWNISYSPGVEEGSFYLLKWRYMYPPANEYYITTYAIYDIFYVQDYGDSVTVFSHSTYPEDNSINAVDAIGEKAASLYNSPNPFNPVTTIRYSMPDNGSSPNLEIYNIRGELIKTYSGLQGGPVSWDGSTNTGEEAASGVYLYILKNENRILESNKMLLLK